MARIFISHSSRNNDRAKEVSGWLAANGWDDIFLDLDPERGIAPGERWKEALQKAAQRCEVVLALISPEWLASDWCRPELNTAQLMGKKIIVLLIGSKSSDIPGDLKDAQYVDLIHDPDAYTRLKEGLKKAGLDPASFPFEEGRRPYPGLLPLEEKDAAIFFGRDAQIVRGLDKLRRLARTGVERMLIILGASGCGKSSFLRAGLWPRLQRDDRTWLPLPTIRPERAVISGQFGLGKSLYDIMNVAPFAEKLQKQDLPRSRADIKEFVEKQRWSPQDPRRAEGGGPCTGALGRGDLAPHYRYPGRPGRGAVQRAGSCRSQALHRHPEQDARSRSPPSCPPHHAYQLVPAGPE